jgi:hypothetical protein
MLYWLSRTATTTRKRVEVEVETATVAAVEVVLPLDEEDVCASPFDGVRLSPTDVLESVCAYELALLPLHAGCSAVHSRMVTAVGSEVGSASTSQTNGYMAIDVPLGVAGKSVDMALGQLRILLRVGVKSSSVTVELAVVVYAFLRLSYSGYGVNSHGTVSWSQSSGWK